MKISSLYTLPINNKILNKSNKEMNQYKKVDIKSLYPFWFNNYVSFGASNVNRLYQIGEDSFPNDYILNRTKQGFANNETTTIYEIHNEYFGDLLNCKTLEEAKEKYPEFKYVVDAKDFPPQEHGILSLVQNGEIKDVSIEDLTLIVLQKHFVGLKNTGAERTYWNQKDRAVNTLFNKLNIKPLSKFYTVIVAKQSPYSPYQSDDFRMKQRNKKVVQPAINQNVLKLDEEKFPNKDILNAYKKAIEKGEDKKLSQIHDEYYADLLNCKTLEEAKEKYPEFKNVIDAKDVSKKHYLSILNKIENGEIEDVSIDDLALKLLQKHYAKRVSIFDKDNFYGISRSGICSLFGMLNIPQINYLKTMALESSPILTYGRSIFNDEYWNSAENKAKHSESVRKGWQRKHAGEKPNEIYTLAAAKNKITNLCKYSETLSTAVKFNKEFQSQFSTNLQNSKDFKKIIFKLDLNEPILDEDKDVIDKFFAECQKSMKDYSWTLDVMRKEILTGLGFELEADNNEN